MTDSELVEAFETAGLTADQFPHVAHVRVAWYYLRRLPLLDALTRFRSGLQRVGADNGKPERYHETITVAYVLLIFERLRDSRDLTSDEFSTRHPDLLMWNPSVLEDYYSEALLASPRAREVFVMPDRIGVDGLMGPHEGRQASESVRSSRGSGHGVTMTVTSASVVAGPSSARARRTYVPGVSNVTVVSTLLSAGIGGANHTGAQGELVPTRKSSHVLICAGSKCTGPGPR